MTLDMIYREYQRQCEQELAAQQEKERQGKIERYNTAAARLAEAAEQHPILVSTLGLGIAIREGEYNAYLKGKTGIQGVEIMTELRVGYQHYDSVGVWMGTTDQGVFFRLEEKGSCITRRLAQAAEQLLDKLKKDAQAEEERQAQAERRWQEAQTIGGPVQIETAEDEYQFQPGIDNNPEYLPLSDEPGYSESLQPWLW